MQIARLDPSSLTHFVLCVERNSSVELRPSRAIWWAYDIWEMPAVYNRLCRSKNDLQPTYLKRVRFFTSPQPRIGTWVALPRLTLEGALVPSRKMRGRRAQESKSLELEPGEECDETEPIHHVWSLSG